MAPPWLWPAASSVPTDRAPWSVYEEPTPRVRTSQEWLGREFNPVCPTCGVVTEEGRILPEGDRFLVQYGCGHQLIATLEELRARTLPNAV